MTPTVFPALVSNYLAEIRANRAVPRVLAEAALYAPLDSLLNGFLLSDGWTDVRAVQQARTEFGIPDFVLDKGGPIGYVEAKKPSTDLGNLRQRDTRQLESFLQLPNLLLTNYREFNLYEDGELVERVVLGGLEVLDHRQIQEPAPAAVGQLHLLLTRFASHRISPPTSVGDLAHALARATRVLQDSARAALRAAPAGALAGLLEEWRTVLFHEATDDEFADSYAQAVTYGLLTARLDMDGDLSVDSALGSLRARHPFLAAALRLLTDPDALEEVGWAVELVIQTLDGVGRDIFARSRHAEDPLLYFYEDFLAEYDAGMRKRRGVYFTPASVVGFQVRAIAEQLSELGRDRLLADDVVALDPAAGTGTYLLGLLDETIAQVRRRDGEGAVSAAVAKAADHLNGFEILVGPYTVAHQRIATRLASVGVDHAAIRVFLVDTLTEPDAPSSGQLRLPFERQLSEERARADQVKRDQQVMVVLGNPPYERGKARPAADWLQRQMTLFTGPVSRAARVNLKNLADAYVYFFRWSLWKLFESTAPSGPRLLTFISNRSYLGGDAFEGVRLALRQRFDDIWIVDLEGERRGPMASENIFDQIQVGVAIVIALRRDSGREKDAESKVRYARVTGTRQEKEQALKGGLDELEWTEVDRAAGAPFLPEATAQWRRWIALHDLMPLRQSGVETKRDALTVGVTTQRLMQQIDVLADEQISLEDRRRLFHETRDRKLPSRVEVDASRVRRYGYRPFDIRWLYDDSAFIDFPRPKLHEYWHDGQRAFVTLPKGHGPGPVVVLQTEIPDRHAYRGSFGGHVFPLWLDAAHREPNLTPGFLRLLRSHLKGEVSAHDVFAYIFGLLNAPSYHERFPLDLAQGFPRIPFPVRAAAFEQMASLGRALLEVHAMSDGVGRARFTGEAGPIVERPIWSDGRLRVTDRGFVEPVSEPAWDYSVSGYRVIENWLRKGRVGLDLSQDWSVVESLLRVVNAVEESVRRLSALDEALAAILDEETLSARALLKLNLQLAASEFARDPAALAKASREAELWDAVSQQALLEVDP